MQRFLAITLILFSLFWLLYASFMVTIAKYSSLSDAASFQKDLYVWTQTKIDNGKLDQEDLEELFPKEDNYSTLKLSGENKSLTFMEMILSIAERGTVPALPGLIALIIGIIGILRLIKKKRQP